MPKSIPAGYREMSPMEGDALKWRYPVLLFDRESGSFLHATVRGVLSGSVKLVTDIGQTVIELTLDNPDFWGDNVPVTPDDATRDAPQSYDGQYIAVMSSDVPSPNDSLLETQLRLSNAFAKIESRLAAVEAANHRLANFVQGAPTRDDYDALVADTAAIHEQLRAASLRVA